MAERSLALARPSNLPSRWVWVLAVTVASIVALIGKALGVNVIWIQVLIGLITAGLILYRALRHRLWATTNWIIIGAGVAFYCIGSEFWNSSQNFSDSGAFHNSFASILYTIGLLLFITAMIGIIIKARRNSTDSTSSLDATIVFVAVSLIAIQALIYPTWMDPTLSTSVKVGIFTYTFLFVILLSVTIRLWYTTEAQVNRAIRTFASGMIIMLLTDIAFIATRVPAIGGEYSLPSVWPLISSMVFYGIMGAAALDPTAARPPAGDSDSGLTDRSRLLVTLSMSILVPPLILLINRDRTGGFSNHTGFVLLTLLLAALFAYRVSHLIKNYREALRREHTLREINADLMRCTDAREILHKLPPWATQLVEQPGVTATIGTLDDLAARAIGPFGSRFRNQRGEIKYRTVIAVPGVRPQRRIVIETSEVITSAEQTSLSVLGQSIGMVLERLALARSDAERAAAERLELLLHNASDVIALVDMSGQIRYATEAMREVIGREPVSVVGLRWVRLFEDPAIAMGLLERARVDGESHGDLVLDPKTISFENDLLETMAPEAAVDADFDDAARRLDVTIVWIENDEQYVVTHHDVTDRYNLEQQLAYQAFHDELTGLNNRAVFREQLAGATERATRLKRSFAVLMIDLDDFKMVNDSLGHPTGDKLLRVVAERLTDCMREGDTPVRLGGDEFAAVLESAGNEKDAIHVAERILSKITEPMELFGDEVAVGASIGIAISDGSHSPSEVERDADIALYEAKFSGKNRITSFREKMHDTAVRRLALSNEIRGALEDGSLFLRYQPIVELNTGGIVGAEALIRWNHPRLGEILPGDFIPLVENTDIIIEVGKFVMANAIADLAEWTRRYPKHSNSRVTINFSGRQLTDSDAAGDLARLIKQYDVDPSRVVAEVTESILLPDDSQAIDQLAAIRDIGSGVYIDDFGTGYSSLHYLRSLPVTGVKLAQEFVSDLPNVRDEELIRLVQQLSESMQMNEVIAEGIETKAQKNALIEMNYHLGQGFLMHRSLAKKDFFKVLQSTKPGVWSADQGADPIQRST